MGTTLLFSLSVTSADGQLREFPGCYILWMLEDRGSRCWSRQVAVILFTSGGMGGGTGETRGGRRRGREGEFLLWTGANSGSAGCLHPRLQRHALWGKVHFLNWRKQTVRPSSGGTQWLLGVNWGRRESSFMRVKILFSNWLDWLIHESLDCSGPG